MLDQSTLRHPCWPASVTTEIALVDTRMVNTSLKKDGISHQEKFYIGREVRIKHHGEHPVGQYDGTIRRLLCRKETKLTPPFQGISWWTISM